MTYKILLFIFCLFAFEMNALSQTSSGTEKVETDSLKTYQIQKLKQEIQKLKSENSISPGVQALPTYGGIVTALIAVLGTFFSFWKYLKEKHTENKIHLEAKFNSVINNLGSSSHSIQASAAVSLLTFLNPEYKEFHHQAYLILLANLKSELPDNVNALLVKTFEKAIRLKLEALHSKKSDDGGGYNIELDLTRANLYRIDLHGLNLENVDFAFSNLRSANLDGCNLKRAKGFKTDLSCARLSRTNMAEGRFDQANFENAQFHETNLVSAKLKNTNLKGAEFQQAQLQDAHLDGSDICGAKFEHANLNNAFLKEIKYNNTDLMSISKAKDASWEKANFDKGTFEKIKQLPLNKKRAESNCPD
ncbi:pentapeptide repeat-containing protein [Parabacteroides sp. FAFU027]|uniref:pentapeptide repeat-containing protein n=1 Tax=Parabacteroides sp. FAFU027 TaxID=2922715 RepID=UPI001FAEDE58|nr:pentapeptide repeat-containing protein [Parabacteroides sp. FAFU027]